MLGRISGLLSLVVVFAAAIYLFAWQRIEPGPFYLIDQTAVSGQPGRIIRSEPMPGAPAGSRAYRILYVSTSDSGSPIAVSGVVIVPDGPAPEGGRPIYAWAHPTSGIANRCAPSADPQMFRNVHGLKDFLDAGFVVAATDYEGLGPPGTHPYLVGDSEARSIIDSVRAARQLKQADASNRFAIWGYSQGGQGALFAAAMVKSYAPELKLVGVAATAPPTRLDHLLQDDIRTLSAPHPGLSDGAKPHLFKLYNDAQTKILSAYVVSSWKKLYDMPLDGILQPTARPVVDRMATRCTTSKLQDLLIAATSRLAEDGFVGNKDFGNPRWKSFLAKNSPRPRLPGVPIYLLQGTADLTVRPAVTGQFAEQLCANSAPVKLDWLDGANHQRSGPLSAGRVAAWMSDRFAGKPPPDMCNNLPPLPNPPPDDRTG